MDTFKMIHSMRVVERNKNVPCPICGQIMKQHWFQPPSLDDSKKCWSGFYYCVNCNISWQVQGGGALNRAFMPLCPKCGEALMEELKSDDNNKKTWHCPAGSTFLLKEGLNATVIPELIEKKQKTAM